MMNTNLQTEPQDFGAIFATLDAIKRAWMAFATGPAPDDRQLAAWNRQQFSEAELIHAFRRVGAKFRNGYSNPEMLYRYATGVLVGERKMKVAR
jgi:hypothetical protein